MLINNEQYFTVVENIKSEITKSLPKEYENQLPSVEDLQNRIKE